MQASLSVRFLNRASLWFLPPLYKGRFRFSPVIWSRGMVEDSRLFQLSSIGTECKPVICDSSVKSYDHISILFYTKYSKNGVRP